MYDKHARYISEIATSPAKSRRSRMNHRAIMAHIVASITVFVNAPPLYLPRRYAIATQGLPRCLVLLFRENGGQIVMFFWHLHVFTPNKGDLLYLIRNKVDY